jgi:hypothetical protein
MTSKSEMTCTHVQFPTAFSSNQQQPLLAEICADVNYQVPTDRVFYASSTIS